MQRLRLQAILALIEKGPVTSQEELQRLLRKQGFPVGQATLSRDIRKLGLVKAAGGYELHGGDSVAEPLLPPVKRLVGEFVLNVRIAQNLLVLKTTVGSASPVAAAIDSAAWPEVVGSIAGDDSILLVTANNTAAATVAKRVRQMLA